MAEAEKLNMHLLVSVKTGKVYIDEEGICEISLSEPDAKKLPQGKRDVRVETKRYTMNDIGCLCYGAGADKIRFHKDGAVQLASLQPTRLKKAPYNHLTNQVICRAKQDENYSLLFQLSKGFFFVPVRIDQKDDVDIFYGTAKHARMEGESYFIAFSTIEEYQVWASKQDGYSPLKISYPALRQISGKHGWIINPQGNQLVLTDIVLAQIDKEAEKNV